MDLKSFSAFDIKDVGDFLSRKNSSTSAKKLLAANEYLISD